MIQKGKKKAIVIGISDYQDDILGNLGFCKNDADAMCEILKKNGYELPDDKILIGNIGYSIMKKTMIDFFRDENIEPEDTLLFYFSGHGVLDGFGGRFFGNTEISSKLPERDGIPFNFLTEQMQKSNSFKKVAILDCCFSGAALAPIVGKSVAKGEAEKLGNEALHKAFEGSEGNCILASSLSGDLSYSMTDKPFSVFSYYVIEGLRGAKGAYDEEFCVTPLHLSEYVFSQLRKMHNMNQKPLCTLSVAGKIILAEIERPKETIETLMNQSDEYRKQEKYEEAIGCCDKALRMDRYCEIALYDKANILDWLGRYEESLECYDRLVNKAKSEFRYDASALTKKCLALRMLGRDQEAAEIESKGFN